VSSTSLDSRASETAAALEILTRLEKVAELRRAVATATAARTVAPPVPTPEVPTPEVPTPEVPTPEVPTPEVPTPEVMAAEAVPSSDEHLPHRGRRASTIDLFPYDLAASIVGCALTIMACIALGRAAAFALTALLVGVGELLRRRRWFPSLGVNLVIGTAVGLIFVLVS
jgi:hypothetical protein